MAQEIKIKKGVDIVLEGLAEKVLTKSVAPADYALVPSDFTGVVPKLLVAAGDRVKAGSALFYDKERPEILFTSPVSGVVKEVVRGEKRKILVVVVESDGGSESESFPTLTAGSSKDEIRTVLLQSGLWPAIVSRPFGFIADPNTTPRDIFITGVDTAPLAADLNYLVQDEAEHISLAVALLAQLTCGKVHLTLASDTTAGALSKVNGVEVHRIEGPHPAGNVGTQIAAIAPIAKGETVWTVGVQHLAMIGRLAATGKADFQKIIALAGSEVKKPHYYKTVAGAALCSVLGDNLKHKEGIRLVNGNPLCGKQTTAQGYVGFYNNEIVALPEGDHHEFLGWAMPRLGKFSLSKSYFSWLMPRKKYNLDTNLNGGERALVMNDVYNKVMPMDIYPVYLLKAIIAGDIDKMEQLGIYEVVEEDFALCEFVCPSKVEWQSILRAGINKMVKEL